jgi:hypothetical protein
VNRFHAIKQCVQADLLVSEFVFDKMAVVLFHEFEQVRGVNLKQPGRFGKTYEIRSRSAFFACTQDRPCPFPNQADPLDLDHNLSRSSTVHTNLGSLTFDRHSAVPKFIIADAVAENT